MVSKFFSVKVPIHIPAVATIGQATAFADGDVLFNWTSFPLPRGGAKLCNVGMHVQAKGDGSVTVNEFPVDLLFSTSNSVALGTLGSTAPDNATQRLIAGHVEIVAGNYVPDLDAYSFADTSRVEGNAPNIVLSPDVTYDLEEVMYVGGIAKDAFDLRSLCRSTGAVATSARVVAVDGTDPRKMFAVGDTLVNNTTADTSIETALGVIESIGDANTITFKENITASVADNDYMYNKFPITLILSFER